jgi:hypothetical protein
VWAYARQVNPDFRAIQQWSELAGKREAIKVHLVELHHYKSALKTDRGITVDLNTARAQARDVAATINYDGMSWLAFARAYQNAIFMITLLDTLPTPSTDGVYCDVPTKNAYRPLIDFCDWKQPK